tara:strand:+ start:1015 stop:1989 length:975 start_codon:yes stop_codon:yes gene_type:complete
MNILVIPTIREICIQDFLDAWRKQGDWDDIIVVEDNPTKTFDINVEHHYSWAEIEEDLKEDAWIISRRDSAIRSYGFLKAYQMNADYIFTLDDDCYPDPDSTEGFCAGHMREMNAMPAWTESIPGVRTRGLPYHYKGRLLNVVANMGLWKCTPDWDSIQTLSGNTVDFEIPERSRLIPRGQYFPFCGMNFGFRSDMAVASFFPLMGEGSPYRRFDDIWFGIIFKKVADFLGYNVAVGVPAVQHLRASDPMTNLVKEAPGIKTNERFWEVIDDVEFAGPGSPVSCMQKIGGELKHAAQTPPFSKEEIEYFNRLGEAILAWAKYFK